MKEELVSACFTEKTLFGSFEDGTIVHWNCTKEGEVLNEFIGHTKKVTNLYVEDDLLISGSYDGTIRTWKVSVKWTLPRVASQKWCIRQTGQ